MTAIGKKFITVVSGLPRSGTSMMIAMLDAGGIPIVSDNIRRADEDNPNGYYEFEPVKKLSRDTSWLVDARGKAVKVIYSLLYFLPKDHDYRVIFMRRKVHEVIASQKAMLLRQGAEGSRLDDARLAQAFYVQLQKLDTWIRNQDNFAVLNINHHDVVYASKNAVIEIDRFLGCGLDRDAMVKLVNPALHRQKR